MYIIFTLQARWNGGTTGTSPGSFWDFSIFHKLSQEKKRNWDKIRAKFNICIFQNDLKIPSFTWNSRQFLSRLQKQGVNLTLSPGKFKDTSIVPVTLETFHRACKIAMIVHVREVGSLLNVHMEKIRKKHILMKNLTACERNDNSSFILK